MSHQDEKADVARRGVRSTDADGVDDHDERLLSVLCRRRHHVASIYDTPAGLVFEALTGGPRRVWIDLLSSEDRNPVAPVGYVDLLEPTLSGDNEIAAWCACGPWTLSRRLLQRQVSAGLGTVVLP